MWDLIFQKENLIFLILQRNQSHIMICDPRLAIYLLKQHANRYVDFGNHGFHVFHCLVYLSKQHANRYVDFRNMEI